MRDALTVYIDFARLMVQRDRHRYRESKAMPLIEVKGLSQTVAAAREGIKSVREAAASLHVSASAFAAEAADVTKQIEQARSDLKFEAETLGNSASAVSSQTVNANPGERVSGTAEG
jgi:hypothetical protein